MQKLSEESMTRDMKNCMEPTIISDIPPPSHELGFDTFENLCCNLFSEQSDITTCERYKTSGQQQYGVDIIVSVHPEMRKFVQVQGRRRF